MLAGVSLRAHPWVPELGGQTCPRVAVSPGVVPFPKALPSLHSGWVPLVFTSTVPGWRHGCVPRFSQAHPWLGAFSPCSPCLPEVCPSRRRRPICTMSCRGLPKPTPSVHLHCVLRGSAQVDAVDPFAPCLAEVCPSRHLRSICTMSSGGLSKPAPSTHLHHVFQRSAQVSAFGPSTACLPEGCPGWLVLCPRPVFPAPLRTWPLWCLCLTRAPAVTDGGAAGDGVPRTAGSGTPDGLTRPASG